MSDAKVDLTQIRALAGAALEDLGAVIDGIADGAAPDQHRLELAFSFLLEAAIEMDDLKTRGWVLIRRPFDVPRPREGSR